MLQAEMAEMISPVQVLSLGPEQAGWHLTWLRKSKGLAGWVEQGETWTVIWEAISRWSDDALNRRQVLVLVWLVRTGGWAKASGRWCQLDQASWSRDGSHEEQHRMRPRTGTWPRKPSPQRPGGALGCYSAVLPGCACHRVWAFYR